MTIETLVEESKQKGAEFITHKGTIHSVNPPETLFGYTYWAHAIPPIKPESMLVLGYGSGTVPKLVRKIFGNSFECHGIDLAIPSPQDHDIVVQSEAFKFVMECDRKYDYICVDLWNGGKCEEFVVWDKKFIENLKRIAGRFVSLNISPPKNYHEHVQLYKDAGFNPDRFVIIQNQIIEWYSV